MKEFINVLFSDAYNNRGIIYFMFVFFTSLFTLTALDERFGIIKKLFSGKKKDSK